jgi:hypothetical protein
MLSRMYNLNMHTSLPIADVPWQWTRAWSDMLEADLERRRLEQRQWAAAQRRNNR